MLAFGPTTEFSDRLLENLMITKDPNQFEVVDRGLLVRAPAKLNISLLIAGKRADGFHEIETIMAKINYFDEILIEPGPPNSGITLDCRGPHWVPPGPDNLVHQAATLILAGQENKRDINLTLTKNIPAGTGLGSASSDAAAILMGLNRYFHLGHSTDRLHSMASQLGSDVAFFLHGPLSLCRGRGEKIERIDKAFPFSAIVTIPSIKVSTKRVYTHYVHNHALYQRFRNQINAHIDENRIDLVAKMCTNMLSETCFRLERKLAELKKRLESLGIGPVCLSGSGSALYCIVKTRDLSQLTKVTKSLAQNVNCNSMIVNSIGW